MRRAAQKPPDIADIGEELELRKPGYGSDVAYIPGEPGGPIRSREQRRDRMRLLARRTERGQDWIYKCPLDERAVAVGVNLKAPAQEKAELNMRANKKRSS